MASYWRGFGYTLATGVGATVGGAALLLQECPSSSLIAPTLVVIPVQAITTLVWASQKQPAPAQLSLMLSRPRIGQGAVFGFGTAF